MPFQRAGFTATKLNRTGPPVIQSSGIGLTSPPGSMNSFWWMRRKARASPRSVLSQLCAALGLPFQESMLHWPPGPRDTDGIWAKHWYNAVKKIHRLSALHAEEQTFAGASPQTLRRVPPFYKKLYALRIKP
jgi:hypothetical protein